VSTSPTSPHITITGNVLTNDTAPGGSKTATDGTIATSQGGSATMNADGTFTYFPPAGCVGSASFDDTLHSSSSPTTDSGTVSINVIGPKV
jgi:hypothetical protein